MKKTTPMSFLAACEQEMDGLLNESMMGYLDDKTPDEQLVLLTMGFKMRNEIMPDDPMLVSLAAYALVTHRLKRQRSEDATTEGTVAV